MTDFELSLEQNENDGNQSDDEHPIVSPVTNKHPLNKLNGSNTRRFRIRLAKKRRRFEKWPAETIGDWEKRRAFTFDLFSSMSVGAVITGSADRGFRIDCRVC